MCQATSNQTIGIVISLYRSATHRCVLLYGFWVVSLRGRFSPRSRSTSTFPLVMIIPFRLFLWPTFFNLSEFFLSFCYATQKLFFCSSPPSNVPSSLCFACVVLRLLHDLALDAFDKPQIVMAHHKPSSTTEQRLGMVSFIPPVRKVVNRNHVQIE